MDLIEVVLFKSHNAAAIRKLVLATRDDLIGLLTRSNHQDRTPHKGTPRARQFNYILLVFSCSSV